MKLFSNVASACLCVAFLASCGTGTAGGAMSPVGTFGGTQVAQPPGAAPQHRTYVNLYSFGGRSGDGTNPIGDVIADPSGNLYGVTDWGAGYSGAVFELSPSGQEIALTALTQGMNPLGGLAHDSRWNLYGVADEGGPKNAGLVFKITPQHVEQVLHDFHGGDGEYPHCVLVRDAAGNLYGAAGGHHRGLVFEIAPTGAETVLHYFAKSPSDGRLPAAGVLRDATGNLFGTTFQGGKHDQGTVYEVTTSGTESLLYSFSGGGDGALPESQLTSDSQGILYGTTTAGGNGYGVVFELSPNGVETVLHAFTGTDGAQPLAGVIRGAGGDLYGTTYVGGAYGYGTIYRIDTHGTEKVLHDFTGGTSDGKWPQGRLLKLGNRLFGTVYGGAAFGAGAVFALTL